MSKEVLNSYLEIIGNATGKTASDIALEMRYKKNYISEMLTPKGKVTEKFLNAFQLKYKDILENPKKDFEVKYIERLEKTIEEKDSIITDLRKQIAKFEDIKNVSPSLKKLKPVK